MCLGEVKDGKLFVKDLKTGEIFEIGLGELSTTIELSEPEVKECVPDGIDIHITGTQLDKISNIEIYMKGE